MKKGRPGTRIEVLCTNADAGRLESLLFTRTTTIGVRRTAALRRALPREVRTVMVFGHPVSLKVVTLPDGSFRAKPEFDDAERVAAATGKTPSAVRAEALIQAGL
jgi:uncharacterized protein (DUF111 family)